VERAVQSSRLVGVAQGVLHGGGLDGQLEVGQHHRDGEHERKQETQRSEQRHQLTASASPTLLRLLKSLESITLGLTDLTGVGDVQVAGDRSSTLIATWPRVGLVADLDVLPILASPLGICVEDVRWDEVDNFVDLVEVLSIVVLPSKHLGCHGDPTLVDAGVDLFLRFVGHVVSLLRLAPVRDRS